MNRPDHHFLWKWHIAINQLSETHMKPGEFPSWMYRAKDAAEEVPRLALLFEMERTDKLAKVHHQCSHDAQGTPVQDNHLSCCMGVKCRECPFLLALDKVEAKPEEIDQIKAWTCVTHILSESGKDNFAFDVSEGFILTVDDKMYWQRLYTSLAGMSEDNDDEHEPYSPPYSDVEPHI